jgi:hypothetical protein
LRQIKNPGTLPPLSRLQQCPAAGLLYVIPMRGEREYVECGVIHTSHDSSIAALKSIAEGGCDIALCYNARLATFSSRCPSATPSGR